MTEQEKTWTAPPAPFHSMAGAAVSKHRDDLLNYFAGLSMQKLLTIKPIKDGVRYEVDCKMAWAIARAMLDAKDQLEKEQAKAGN